MGVSVGRHLFVRAGVQGGQWVLLVKEQQVAVCCWARHFSPLESRELAILMDLLLARRIREAALLQCP